MCSKKFEGAYLIENHGNSLLFCYYKLGFRCLEHDLFSRFFDLKALSLNKRFGSKPASRLALEHKPLYDVAARAKSSGTRK